jgi:hypothetical protein
MTKIEELQDNILCLLEGIDKTEIEQDDGWWETSAGADFGAEILQKINNLFAELKYCEKNPRSL